MLFEVAACIKAFIHIQTVTFYFAASISNAIAFMSYESASREYMPGEVILFDTINLNIGESYSGQSGKFTCPVSGLYFFSATGANPGNNYLHV